jgi:hypothetical protein
MSVLMNTCIPSRCKDARQDRRALSMYQRVSRRSWVDVSIIDKSIDVILFSLRF